MPEATEAASARSTQQTFFVLVLTRANDDAFPVLLE
jgi:hypothetical protein